MGLKSDDAYTAELRAILRTALTLKDVVGASHSTCCSYIVSDPDSLQVDSVSLPSPPPLFPSLLESGCSQEIAAALSKTYQSRAEEYRRQIQQFMVTACRDIAKSPAAALAPSPDQLTKKIISTFTVLYLRCLSQWREGAIQRIKPSISESSTPTKQSPAFNHKYIPLLEHFFAENPFPTHVDKVFLAEKTNMQYKQIHVWFQNRRNRTKQERQKKRAHKGARKPLDELCELMGSHTKHSPRPASIISKSNHSGTLVKITAAPKNVPIDQFASSPPHAFPSSYPPTCQYDPFPCKSGLVYFAKPEWRHIPSRKPSPPPSVSVDDLVESFARLNVRDEARPRGSSRTSMVQAHAATVAITVIPSHAPHPSLKDRQYVQPINISPLPSVRAPTSQLKVFHHQGSTSPVTLVPSSVPASGKERPMKRKIAPLPQRLPSRPSNDRRDTSSSSSSSPHLSSTDSESPSLSSGSPFSMPPSIPEFPQLFESRCRSSVGGPIHSRRLGDMVTIAPSAVS